MQPCRQTVTVVCVSVSGDCVSFLLLCTLGEESIRLSPDEFVAHPSLTDDTSLWLNVAKITRSVTVCGLQRRTTHERTTTTQTKNPPETQVGTRRTNIG